MKKFRKVLKIFALVSCVFLIALTIFGFLIIEPNIKINGFKSLDKEKLNAYSQAITINDKNGNAIIGSIYDKNRIYTPLSKLNKQTINAFIAVEDKRFYSHKGIDYLRILSAMKNNILSGEFREGASTISQQLIKNTHLTNEKTINRKLQEIRIARDLERNYSKEKILEMYLNSLYFGNGVYGIGSASRAYFGINASELSLSQSAIMAGIINSPARYDLYRNYNNALKRRNSVLGRMLEQNLISDNEYKLALNEDTTPTNDKVYSNQYINGCINDASDMLNINAEGLYFANQVINTYCDQKIQNSSQEILNSYNLKNADISALVCRNSDGAYLSYASTSLCDISQIKRQPGSTIKPFISFAPAIENNLVYPCTPIFDKKTLFGDYSPSNFNNVYYGWTDIKTALSKSMNVPAVKLMEMNGIQNSINFATKFGLKFAPQDYSLSSALGGLTYGLSLRNIVDAYRVFANNGYYSCGKFVKNIVDKNGNTVINDKTVSKIKVISEETAYLMNYMLNDCARHGTAKKIGRTFPNACAKTGTVGDKKGNTDAYCIAYTPLYTVGVRISALDGYMDNSYSGGSCCAEIASKILNILGDYSNFETPNGIVFCDIDERELMYNHKVLLAGNEILPISRRREIFSAKNTPKEFSTLSAYNENKSQLDYFNNFQIIDRFFD